MILQSTLVKRRLFQNAPSLVKGLFVFVLPFEKDTFIVCFCDLILRMLFLFRWKEVRHDNTVTWLAFWNDPINPREFKYVFLAASSALKGLSDKEKYEKARKLKVMSVLFR